jgi:hypothetical protein
VVVSVGGDAYAYLAAEYASASGAAVVTVDHLVHVTDPARGVMAPETSLVIVTAAHLLSLDLVEEIAAACAAHPRTRVGYLTADTYQACTVAVTAAERSLAGGPQVRSARRMVDHIRGKTLVSGSGGCAEAAVHDVLGRESRALYLVGHGDGAHLSLPDSTVVCGLRGDVERAGGRAVVDGCRAVPTGCKRIPRGSSKTLVRARDIEADMVALFSCRSFLPRPGAYPSDLSLLLALAEAGTQAVVGTTRMLPLDRTLPEEFDALLREGIPIGEAVAFLNDVLLRRRGVPAFAVWGDPDARFDGPDHHGLAMDVSARCDRADPEVVAATDGEDGWSHVVRGRTRFYAMSRTTNPTRFLDQSGQFAMARQVLLDIQSRLANVEAVVRAARWYAESCDATTYLDRLLGPLQRAVGSIKNQLWFGIGIHAASSSALGVWQPELETCVIRARTLLATLSSAVADITEQWLIREEVAGTSLADHLYPTLHTFRTLRGVEERGDRCRDCGGRLLWFSYEESALGLSLRSAIECATCGPVAEFGGTRTFIEVGGDLRRGGWMDVQTRIERKSLSHRSPVDVVLHAKPRSGVNPEVVRRVTLPPAASCATVRIPLPADAGHESWSVRAASICDAEISFARCMVSILATRAV